ncbi:MAG: hypothetical protein HZA94_01810 [Candidatus Vogelbacteria bacterium]|nr:hypothetical protein [Candidatus Vogelbacteria bacterium]
MTKALLDWTDFYDRKLVIETAKDMIDELISEIHKMGLACYKDLALKELALLCRFPMHVATNIFLERMMRIAFQKANNPQPIYLTKVDGRSKYFNTTDEAITTYYYDFFTNYRLLNSIAEVMVGDNLAVLDKQDIRIKPQDALLQSGISNLKARLKKLIKFIWQSYVKLTKPGIIGEYSNWLREVFPFTRMVIFDFVGSESKINFEARQQIRACAHRVFMKCARLLLDNLDQRQSEKLAEIYADFIDHILPLSVVEGLNESRAYYKSLIKHWNIKQVHSFIGYYYSENFKVFSILAKRKGAFLIGHAHGAGNLISSHKHIDNELSFINAYFTWGKSDSSWMKGKINLGDLRIFPLGSAYLAKIKSWHKKMVESGKIVILYPSGPLMDFMTDLEEITPEKNYQHRLNVLHLLKELWKSYPNFKLLYKPFPGTYTNDPIKKVFSREIEEGKIKLIGSKPAALFDQADIVLWDTVSTGFTESIQAGIPSLVFQPPYEDEQATELGKTLNKNLVKCSRLFYDIESGMSAFKKAIDDLPGFIRAGSDPIRQFQEAVAYPIRKDEFVRRMGEALKN